MPHYRVEVDIQTAERAGALGTFQVSELHDDDADVDCTHLINTGTHYLSFEQLREDVARAAGLPVSEVILDNDE
jgi:hypothetical protein